MARSAADRICLLFVGSYVVVLFSAYLLSVLGLLGSIVAWVAAGGILGVAAVVAILRLLPRRGGDNVEFHHDSRDRSTLPRWLVRTLACSVAAALAVDVIVMFSTAPTSWDALSYHLPRMAYAVQRGSFDLPVANYWAQQTHPVGSTALFVFAYVLSGSERAIAVWQFFSVLTAAAAAWTIGFRACSSRAAATFGAAVFLLTTQALMQANTVGNDGILAALAGCALAWLLQGRATSEPGYFVLAAVAVGLGLATKASFALVLPLLGAVAVFAIAGTARHARRPVAVALGAGCILATLIAVPAGYSRNVRRDGHPLGPEHVRREHTFEGATLSDRLVGGTLNLLRYGLDFASLDGLPRVSVVNDLQGRMRGAVRALLAAVGIDLESARGTRVAFDYERIASAHEVHAYWGVVGLLIIWPAVFLSIGSASPPVPRLLAALAVAFVMLQSYFAPYDPWRGRYFLTCAVFAAPLAARWLPARGRSLRVLRDACLLLACGSALSATILRSNLQLVDVSRPGRPRPSIIGRDRLSQMTVNRPDVRPALQRFEEIVPARATVAVRVTGGSYEYALFGHGLTRTIIPAPPEVALSTLPAFDYLLFDEQLEPVEPADQPLGTGWWLRPGTLRR